jgi:hypothetical protein
MLGYSRPVRRRSSIGNASHGTYSTGTLPTRSVALRATPVPSSVSMSMRCARNSHQRWLGGQVE